MVFVITQALQKLVTSDVQLAVKRMTTHFDGISPIDVVESGLAKLDHSQLRLASLLGEGVVRRCVVTVPFMVQGVYW